ncbi:MAG: hypothetical protein ORO03_01405, partial [Alphaproteobacteria bacterium]|nr:hypothetical protein [Alphaproteobacteria bacterium]
MELGYSYIFGIIASILEFVGSFNYISLTFRNKIRPSLTFWGGVALALAIGLFSTFLELGTI